MARFGVKIAVTEESTAATPPQQFENLPNGVYRLEISAAEVIRKNEDTPQHSIMFKSTFDVIEPEEYVGRKIFGNFNLVNQSSLAQEIGQKQFSQLRRALGFGDVDEDIDDQDVIDEMRLVPFIASVALGKESKEKNADGTPVYSAKPEIKRDGYFYPDLNNAPPIGVTAAANDNKATAKVVAKPAATTTAPAAAGSKPWKTK